MFKKPKSVDGYIETWGLMDSLIRATKKGAALSYWKRHSVPLDADGRSLLVHTERGLEELRYSHIEDSRYWFEEFFRRDMRNWNRLYDVFLTAFSMR